MKPASVWQICVGLLLVAVQWSAQAQQIALRDDRGALVTLQAPPRRIVSLLPSLTECVCALGGCSRLVGTDRFSNWPSTVTALPKLGGLDDAQVESIAALRPDVVLVAPAARLIGRLEALGVAVLAFESRDQADVWRTLSVLARMLGTPGEADKVRASIQRTANEAAARVPVALRGQRVYFEVDTTPYAAGAASFVGETLAQLGMANAVPQALGTFPRLNPEFVVRAQPDVIMASQAGVADMGRRPGWAGLRALQLRKFCAFDGPNFELLTRPGPRMGEAAGVLADCLVTLPAGQ